MKQIYGKSLWLKEWEAIYNLKINRINIITLCVSQVIFIGLTFK